MSRRTKVAAQFDFFNHLAIHLGDEGSIRSLVFTAIYVQNAQHKAERQTTQRVLFLHRLGNFLIIV